MSRKKMTIPGQLCFDFKFHNIPICTPNEQKFHLRKVISISGWRKIEVQQRVKDEEEVISKIVQYSNSLDW